MKPSDCCSIIRFTDCALAKPEYLEPLPSEDWLAAAVAVPVRLGKMTQLQKRKYDSLLQYLMGTSWYHKKEDCAVCYRVSRSARCLSIGAFGLKSRTILREVFVSCQAEGYQQACDVVLNLRKNR